MDIEAKARLRKLGHRYLSSGLSLIVIREGDKKPIHPTWKQYQTVAMSHDELDRWLDRPEAIGVAVVTGAVSGGGPDQWLVIIDFDDNAATAYAYVHAMLQSPERDEYAYIGGMDWSPELMDSLPLIRSGKEEYRCQMYVRVKGGEPFRNRPLAYYAAAKDEKGKPVYKKMVETRGEGGYALAPGSLHPSGNFYRHLRGDICKIPVIDLEQFNQLIAVVKRVDEKPERPVYKPFEGAAIKINTLPPWLVKRCEDGAKQGERNQQLITVAMYLIEYGASEADFQDMVSRFLTASQYGNTAKERDEIEKTLDSARAGALRGKREYKVRA